MTAGGDGIIFDGMGCSKSHKYAVMTTLKPQKRTVQMSELYGIQMRLNNHVCLLCSPGWPQIHGNSFPSAS